MTTLDWRTLEAGRALDQVIAERLGWKVIERSDKYICYSVLDPKGNMPAWALPADTPEEAWALVLMRKEDGLPFFSTSLDAALMKQVYVHVMQSAVWGVLFTLVTVISGIYFRRFLLEWRAYIKGYNDKESEYYYESVPDHIQALTITLGSISVVLIPLITISIISVVSRLINPEYYAIQLLLEQLR